MAGFSQGRGTGSGCNREDEPNQIPFLYGGGSSSSAEEGTSTTWTWGSELWEILLHHQRQQQQFSSNEQQRASFSTGQSGGGGRGSGSSAGRMSGVGWRQQQLSAAAHTSAPGASGGAFPQQYFGGMQVETRFPTEVTSPAVFQCVRISQLREGGDDRYAYETSVSIGGCLFKGILYNQGPVNLRRH